MTSASETAPAVLALTQEGLAQGVRRAEQLQAAILSNRRIGVAVGLVMAQFDATAEAAFELLRRESMNSNRRMVELAEDVIAHRALVPHPERSGRPAPPLGRRLTERNNR